jgi:hypothetical protein
MGILPSPASDLPNPFMIPTFYFGFFHLFGDTYARSLLTSVFFLFNPLSANNENLDLILNIRGSTLIWWFTTAFLTHSIYIHIEDEDEYWI